MKKILQVNAAVMAAVLCMTGCSDSGSKGNGSSSDRRTEGDDVTVRAATVSLEDIKNEFDYDDSRDIMPLYNVDATEKFEFNFNFDAYESDVDLYDFVSVHTESDCSEESKIYYNASLKVENGQTTLTAAPMEPVLATDSQQSEYVYDDVDSWGNAPMYYIALHYDLEADSPVKLEQPAVIPFTVKNEINAPTARGVVSDDGRFSLEWDAVEGAEKYIVYNLTDGKLKTGEDNHAINGSASGYDCGINTDPENQLYLLREGDTAECTFDCFSGPDSHSLAEVEDMLVGKMSNSGQNYGVHGEYFVTAVIDGKESGLSNPVSTAELALPHIITEESKIKGRYPTPADFPSEVEVLNIDGSTSVKKVSYERVSVDWYEYHWEEYDYTVEGTYIYGSVGFDEDNNAGEAPQPADPPTETGNAAPKDGIDRIPDADVDTIIPSDGGNGSDNDGKPLIDAQSDNTKEHIKNANRSEVENAPDGVYINADTAEEKWLALNMVQGNTEISVEGFTSLQDPYTLTDVFYKTLYQNPYILGVTAFTYDYNALSLNVVYTYDKETLAQKQSEIAEKAGGIVGSLIKDDMDAQQKIEILYNYLEDNSVYDYDALEEAKKNGYKKSEDFAFEDSFNTYGILVGGKGVCISYSNSFKLLCDMSDVECIVVTGYLNGNLPHAWNMVRIGDEWCEIDCTNNEANTGIPYYLFQSDSSLAEASGYTKDNMFAIDSEIEEFVGDDSSLEYYYQHGLCPDSMDEYKRLITENVTENTKVFAVRWQSGFDKDAFNRAVMIAYNELGLEDKLETLRCSVTGGFIIIVNGE